MLLLPRSLLLLLAAAAVLQGAEPITTRDDEVGRLMREWDRAGTAAGFGALNYDNHDGNHSPLPKGLYPGLFFRLPTEGEVKAGKDKGLLDIVRPLPTIGNVSMSGPPETFGSLPRVYLTDAAGSGFLFNQYVHNNLYIYPEHLDHDPGANGRSGYGDLFPTNSPCVLISQGSSLSDQPFVKAMFAIAGSLQPEVQRRVIRNRVLIPTLQALFRQNSNLAKTDADYFTGRAHPVVFDASAIDEARMVTAAQLVSPQSIPPIAFIEVLSERKSRVSRDYMERPSLSSEALVTTPAFLSRIVRSMDEPYTMRLSAKRSVDIDHRDLNYRWVLLQGDPKRVTITPNEIGDEATIKVQWHGPIKGPGGIRSHRVDIALFASTGIAWSAPAIASFMMLPCEQRFYDSKGRLTDIIGEAGDPELGLPSGDADQRWLSLLLALDPDDLSIISEALRRRLSPEHLAIVKPEIATLRKYATDLAATPTDNEVVRNRILAAIGKALPPLLRKEAPISLRSALEKALLDLAASPDFFLQHQAKLLPLAAKGAGIKPLRLELRRCSDYAVLQEDTQGTFTTVRQADALSPLDLYSLRQLHLTVLSHVLLPDSLLRSPDPLFTDPRIGTRRPWRDELRYNAEGKLSGWTRHDRSGQTEFNTEGQAKAEPGDTFVPVGYSVVEDRLQWQRVGSTPPN